MIYIYETRNDDIIIRYDIRSYDIREVPFVARHLRLYIPFDILCFVYKKIKRLLVYTPCIYIIDYIKTT